MQWVVGSIPHGPIELFFCSSQCSTTGVTKAVISTTVIIVSLILVGGISHSSQCSTTGVTKAVVCIILSVG